MNWKQLYYNEDLADELPKEERIKRKPKTQQDPERKVGQKKNDSPKHNTDSLKHRN